MRLAPLCLLALVFAYGCSGGSDDAWSKLRRQPTEQAQQAAAPISDVALAASPTTVPPTPVPPTPAPPTPTPEPAPPITASAPTHSGLAPPSLSAQAAVVVDEASAQVIYDKDAFTPHGIASLTKIATAVLAIEHGRLDETVRVDVDSRTMSNSTLMGLLPGDRFTLRDLVYGLMLPSGNDAALAIGRHVAGSDAAFVERMNELAARLGLSATTFRNPHGLSADGHLSSARDVAILSRYAMSLPEFAEVVRTGSYTARGSRTISFSNINPFVFTYPGADGVKTGFTRRAGSTLSASATRDGRRLYVVLLNAPQRETDAHALMNWAFNAYNWDAAQVEAQP